MYKKIKMVKRYGGGGGQTQPTMSGSPMARSFEDFIKPGQQAAPINQPVQNAQVSVPSQMGMHQQGALGGKGVSPQMGGASGPHNMMPHWWSPQAQAQRAAQKAASAPLGVDYSHDSTGVDGSVGGQAAEAGAAAAAAAAADGNDGTSGVW